MKTLNTLLISLLVVFVLSCKKDKNDDEPKQFNETCTPMSTSGLIINVDGDNSDLFAPGSQAYDDYIACLNNCAQTDPESLDCIMDCLSSSGIMPAGGAFTLVLEITNTTAADIEFTVSPGTWFEPGSGDYQAMMTAIDISITIHPGETITQAIPVFCLAQEKDAPDALSDYTICSLVSSDCLTDIIAILATKDMSSLTFEQSMEVQTIIWNCTEGKSVDLDYLNSLPSL